jgi:rhomboid protease GluP
VEETRLVLKQTWLSQKPNSWALVVTALSTLLLVLGCVSYWQDLMGLQALMPASADALFHRHEWWRAWTTLFAHADEKHLLSNTFLFVILGYFLNGYFGILVFPIIAFFFGGLTNFWVLKTSSPDLQVIGASGVVFWMGGVWLALYFSLERRKTLFQRALRAVGVGLLLFFPAEAFDPVISYKSHLIGFLLGVAFGIFYFRIRRKHFRSAEIYELVKDPENFDCPKNDSTENCLSPAKIDV